MPAVELIQTTTVYDNTGLPSYPIGDRAGWDPVLLPDNRFVVFVLHDNSTIAAVCVDYTDPFNLVVGNTVLISAPGLLRRGYVLTACAFPGTDYVGVSWYRSGVGIHFAHVHHSGTTLTVGATLGPINGPGTRQTPPWMEPLVGTGKVFLADCYPGNVTVPGTAPLYSVRTFGAAGLGSEVALGSLSGAVSSYCSRAMAIDGERVVVSYETNTNDVQPVRVAADNTVTVAARAALDTRFGYALRPNGGNEVLYWLPSSPLVERRKDLNADLTWTSGTSLTLGATAASPFQHDLVLTGVPYRYLQRGSSADRLRSIDLDASGAPITLGAELTVARAGGGPQRSLVDAGYGALALRLEIVSQSGGDVGRRVSLYGLAGVPRVRPGTGWVLGSVRLHA